MYLAFKYKLKPTKEQEKSLAQYVGSCRFLWNYFLGLNQVEYKLNKKFIFKHEMITSLPKLKQELLWLDDVPSQSLQQRLIDLEKAIKSCYRNSFGFPKFKAKHMQSDTFRLPQIPNRKHITKKQVKIPKLGWVKWKMHRKLDGKLKSITIKQEGDIWFAICLCEVADATQKQITENNIVGLDLGLETFAVLSDAQEINTPKYYRSKQKKLKQRQRKLSKKKKRSKNREKAKKVVRKIHTKIKNQRHDFTHKASTVITKQYLFVGVEDLNIAGMKKRFGKSISDQGWGMFLQQLSYKSLRNGGKTIKIDRFAPSTKTCSNCGEKHDMALGNRQMICSCGLNISRDLNAAINIKKWAIDLVTNTAGTAGIQACGEKSSGRTSGSMTKLILTKQEKFCILDTEATYFSS